MAVACGLVSVACFLLQHMPSVALLAIGQVLVRQDVMMLIGVKFDSHLSSLCCLEFLLFSAYLFPPLPPSFPPVLCSMISAVFLLSVVFCLLSSIFCFDLH
jgi:hypothetical protein